MMPPVATFQIADRKIGNPALYGSSWEFRPSFLSDYFEDYRLPATFQFRTSDRIFERYNIGEKGKSPRMLSVRTRYC